MINHYESIHTMVNRKNKFLYSLIYYYIRKYADFLRVLVKVRKI